jgi:hypothetical protein
MHATRLPPNSHHVLPNAFPHPPTMPCQAQRLSAENEALLTQVEGLTRARADMLLQLQDLTDKWQQSIAENA